ncbi:CotH kinase family protein [Mucilaginibacter sp.]|jgi:hypothetical protein|uniref:CotH kinase family protein n=1 Tax=Mucilaginibacter sp. TaxID=1882438 RepID=UPI0035634FE7
MRKTITCICLLLLVFGCKKDPVNITVTTLPAAKAEVEFKLETKNNTGKITEDVTCIRNIDNVSFYGSLSPLVESRNFIMTFKTLDAAAVVKVNDVVQTSGVTANDFSKPVTYSVSSGGSVKTYTIRIFNFTGIPVFNISSAGPIVSKDNYVTGNLTINANGFAEQTVKSIDLQIKGRGNSTWALFDKKPYRLKFNTKTPVLGLPAAKNWVLLANYSDKTLMRNYLAFGVAQSLKSDYAPHGIFVEVYLNGYYRGNYLLTEQVEVDANRVNIKELKPANISPAEITGGYLLELENRVGETISFRTKKDIPFVIKSPEDYVPEQLNYIQGYMQQTEDAIFAANFTDPNNGYAKYINTDSFINWFLVNELFKNEDAKKFSSMFYFKDRDGKMGMGPAWDFDLAAGNVNYSESVKPEGWWVKDGVWISRLYEDPAFKAKVKARWDVLKATGIPAMYASINATKNYLALSQSRNFTTWNILDTYVWPNPAIYHTYGGEVDQLNTWLTQRVAWLDSNIK